MTHHTVLILLVLAAKSGACPPICTCTNHPNDNSIYTSVVCDSYYEANFTSQMDNNLQDLTVRHLDEIDVDALLNDLATLPNLTQLTITQSRLPPALNATVGALLKLSLTDNRLTNLTDINLYNNNKNLTSLDLSHNELVCLESGQFRTFARLELLNLSANHIDSIDSDSFSGLVHLKSLDLSGNNLSNINSTLFVPLSTLQFLNLSTNRLSVLNERPFNTLLKLQQLDVSKNRLVQIELSSPALIRLIVSDNQQLANAPITGQKLQTLDASSIGLRTIPSTLTRSIRTLQIAHNAIKMVRCGDLDTYPLLQLLNLKHNGLETIEDDALGRLDSLNLLYLSHNRLKTVPGSLSEKLRDLHLDHNRIETIENRDFQGLAALELLRLNDNSIRTIEEESFGQLGALVALDLSRNPIRVLGCLSSSMMRLEVLRLAGIGVINPAKEVSFPLSSTEHLITLDLAGSGGLARQLLADTAALAACRQLQELDLRDTELVNVRYDLLHFLPQLRRLLIGGNRINCSELEWLGKWMRRQDSGDYEGIACASPPELWGTLLVDLEEGDDELRNEIPMIVTTSSTTTTTTTKAGKKAVLKAKDEAMVAMSKFRSDGSEDRGVLHPGMLILAAGILGAAAALAIVANKCRRRVVRDEEVEGSLPGVTELW